MWVFLRRVRNVLLLWFRFFVELFLPIFSSINKRCLLLYITGLNVIIAMSFYINFIWDQFRRLWLFGWFTLNIAGILTRSLLVIIIERDLLFIAMWFCLCILRHCLLAWILLRECRRLLLRLTKLRLFIVYTTFGDRNLLANSLLLAAARIASRWTFSIDGAAFELDRWLRLVETLPISIVLWILNVIFGWWYLYWMILVRLSLLEPVY